MISISFLGKLIQAFLTFIRGAANEGEELLFKVNSWGYLVVALVELAVSIIAVHLILKQDNPWFYVLLILTEKRYQAIGRIRNWLRAFWSRSKPNGADLK
jgi:hypothetical protein